MACVTRHAALMSVSLASWRSCAKMRSSWTHWKSGTASSARRCDTSCMGDNFSHHCACNLVDHSHGLKVFPLHGCALVQLPDLGSAARSGDWFRQANASAWIKQGLQSRLMLCCGGTEPA